MKTETVQLLPEKPLGVGFRDRGLGRGDYGILDAHGALVAEVKTGIVAHVQEIVQAYNAYDAHVALIRQLVDALSRCKQTGLCDPSCTKPRKSSCEKCCWSRADEAARAALAAAAKMGYTP